MRVKRVKVLIGSRQHYWWRILWRPQAE